MTARILIVDDVPANTRLLEAKLSAEYYQVASARDGFEAVNLARDWQPDLILLDVMMPGMDGFECCKILKEAEATLHIPVVMVTARGESARAERTARSSRRSIPMSATLLILNTGSRDARRLCRPSGCDSGSSPDPRFS